MGLKVTNNAFGTLNAGINSSATTIVLTAGQGARFPTLSAGDYFYATLIDTSNNLEIVKVTARSTDTMTVVRGQDNTTARAYSTNDRFELRPTAALFNEKANDADVAAGYVAKSGSTMTGKLIVGDSTASTAATTLVNGSNFNGTSGRSHQVEFGFDGNQTYRHVIRTRHNSAAAANNAIDFRLWTPSEASDASLGSKTVLTLDGTGAITMPFQPAFHAVLNGPQTMVNNTDFVFGTAFLNRGSHYSTSTGRFTAPVSGVYFIHFEGLSASAERDQLDIRFFINGNQSQVATHYQVDYGGSYRKIAMTAVVNLSANDYIAVRTQAPNNYDFYGETGATIFANNGGGHTGFKGFLVG